MPEGVPTYPPAMRTERVEPGRFLDLTSRITAAEAMHSVIVAAARRLVDEPDAFVAEHHVVGDPVAAGVVVFGDGSAIVTDITDPAAVEPIARLLAARDDISAIQANDPTATALFAAYTAESGRSTELSLAMGAFSLGELVEPQAPPGRVREAGQADRELLIGWTMEFAAEAVPDQAGPREQAERMVDGRLDAATSSGILVWERDGSPVAMTGYSGDTGSGIRVNLVYTPPENRGKGYATALCAAQTAMLRERGYRNVYLFTDLANPTSNAIYERIGYRRVGTLERRTVRRRS